jgi:hypothetical protein
MDIIQQKLSALCTVNLEIIQRIQAKQVNEQRTNQYYLLYGRFPQNHLTDEPVADPYGVINQNMYQQQGVEIVKK